MRGCTEREYKYDRRKIYYQFIHSAALLLSMSRILFGSGFFGIYNSNLFHLFWSEEQKLYNYKPNQNVIWLFGQIGFQVLFPVCTMGHKMCAKTQIVNNVWTSQHFWTQYMHEYVKCSLLCFKDRHEKTKKFQNVPSSLSTLTAGISCMEKHILKTTIV